MDKQRVEETDIQKTYIEPIDIISIEPANKDDKVKTYIENHYTKLKGNYQEVE